MNVVTLNEKGIVRPPQIQNITAQPAKPLPAWVIRLIVGVVALHLALEVAILVALIQLVGG
jgi:hypothetical protein